jgi:hypothetical protein
LLPRGSHNLLALFSTGEEAMTTATASERRTSGPISWKSIVLRLARSRNYPEGSERHGYNILAPLDPEGRIDVETWRQNRERCTVVRHWPGEPNAYGWLRHQAGGEGGATWVIDYDRTSADDDERGYRLGQHRFVVGEYITLAGTEGTHTFRIVNLLSAAAGGAKPGAAG